LGIDLSKEVGDKEIDLDDINLLLDDIEDSSNLDKKEKDSTNSLDALLDEDKKDVSDDLSIDLNFTEEENKEKTVNQEENAQQEKVNQEENINQKENANQEKSSSINIDL